MSHAALPRLQVLLAALCFGTTGTAQALGPDGASPLAVGAVRVALGAALLLLVVRLVNGSTPLRLAPGPLAAGALGVAGYQLCFLPPFTTPALRWVRWQRSAPPRRSPGSVVGSSTAPGRAEPG